MPTAIRIDKSEILYGMRHINLVLDYRDREKLTDDDIDAMFEAGRIEFGAVFLAYDHDGQPFYDFYGDDARDSVYTSIDRMIEINGRG